MRLGVELVHARRTSGERSVDLPGKELNVRWDLEAQPWRKHLEHRVEADDVLPEGLRLRELRENARPGG